MTSEPSASQLQFPCEFPVKVLGVARPDFDSLVVTLVRRHVPDLGEGAVTCRTSRTGKYVSVTVRIQATSRAQLDAVYRELTTCDRVLMAL